MEGLSLYFIRFSIISEAVQPQQRYTLHYSAAEPKEAKEASWRTKTAANITSSYYSQHAAR